MEGRKTYAFEVTKTELKALIWGLDAYKFSSDDDSFESLRIELEELLKSK